MLWKAKEGENLERGESSCEGNSRHIQRESQGIDKKRLEIKCDVIEPDGRLIMASSAEDELDPRIQVYKMQLQTFFFLTQCNNDF